MSSVTLQLSEEILDKMKQFYQAEQIKNKNPHACFTAKTAGCTITIYTSKKVLFQGKEAEKESKIWATSGKTTEKRKIELSMQPHGSFFAHIGSDEVGTGDYFGPMTVCATYIDEKAQQALTDFKIQDSKAMTDSYICHIAPKMQKLFPFSLLILPNEKYNHLQKNGYNQGKMKAYLHNQAILHLYKKIHAKKNPPKTIIDQFAKPSTYYQYLADAPYIAKTNVFFETKAENKYLAVACGSILARYAFLQKMKQMNEKWGMDFPKGASHTVDQAATKFIQTHGIENLPLVAKIHFANTEKAKKHLFN
ncbi:MAG TPA: ribonuclease HIII [Firmicutes bacterium]|nr:ribonuclease HIII [Bacillales bacterium]HJA40240.1 ribonuclease HIII [Bacillota bacterium]